MRSKSAKRPAKPQLATTIAAPIAARPWTNVRISAIAALLASALLLVALVAIAASQENADERDRLANLSTTEKEELRRKRDQFQQLDDGEKSRLRELHTTLSSSPDRARLEETMLQYHEWLKTLPGKERAELLKLPTEQKLAEIKRLMQDQRSQQFRKLVATPPEPNDVRAIFAWFDSYVEAHEIELMAMLPEPMQNRVKQASHDGMRRKLLVGALYQNGAEPKFPTPTPDDLQKLNERLSPQAKETLAKVTDPEEKLKLVQGWLRAAMMSRMLPPQISDERLMSYFRENRARLLKEDAAKVDELESLPPEAFYQEVRNIYFRERGPERWRHRRDGDDGPPGEWHGGRDGGRDGNRDGGPRGRDDRDGRGPGGNGPRRPRSIGHDGVLPGLFRPRPAHRQHGAAST